ncbi:MAG: crossover junction endodeoxyribonuclease RuvC [Candidatus Taylorbacteria bacterium]|nr:crossover junction endodeoxyribonuclease RuvC [Candidatus Taylorbacteria bacterium]
MKILAIDPGYDRMGLAILTGDASKPVVVHSECVVTNRKDENSARLWTIVKRLENVIKEFKPETMAVETLLFSVNQKTAIGVAEARGAIICEAGRFGIPVLSLNPNQIKVAVTGYGASKKQGVTDMVKRLAKTRPDIKYDDEYDAIAIGIAGLAINRTMKQKS